MKKGHIKLLIISLVLVIILVFNSISQFFSLYTYALFLLGVFLITKKLIGSEKDDFTYKKEITIVIIGGLLLYYIVSYSTVFFWGILQNRFVLSWSTFVSTIFPLFLIIIFTELLRFIIIRKGRRYTSIWLITALLFTLVDVTLKMRGYDFNIEAHVLKFFVEVVSISLATNIFLCYLVNKAGYKPAIMFRLLFELPLYLLPFFPNLGIFIDTILKVLLPNLLLFFIYFKYSNKNDEQRLITKQTKFVKRLSVGIMITLAVIMVGIFSMRFHYYAIVVGSGSMSPNINRGDITFARRVNDINSLEVNDVLIFRAENIAVIHRITRIEYEYGERLIFTKGDANTSEDYYPVREENILGVAIFRVRYLGLPTVWLNDQINDSRPTTFD